MEHAKSEKRLVFAKWEKNNLKTLISNGPKFIEQFTEYTYKGDTITSEDGTESITGNAKPETKILITRNCKK